MLKGTFLFRDSGAVFKHSKLFLVVGQLWVPADTLIKPEHTYPVIGSQYGEGDAVTVGLGILINGGQNISEKTRKKNVLQILPLLHTPEP